MLPPTVQITEVIWTCSPILGILLWVIKLRIFIHVRLLVQQNNLNGKMRIQANAAIFESLSAILVLLSLMGLGVFAMTMRPAVYKITTLGWAVTVELVFIASIITVVGAVWRFADVKTMREEIKKINPEF